MDVDDEYMDMKLARWRSDYLADLVLIKFERFYRLWLKANFDPSQPRVPRGRPDGGQWTRGEDWRSTLDDERPEPHEIPSLPDSFGLEPSEEQPDIPQERPKASRERTAVMRRAARWMLRNGWRLTPAGRAIMLAKWLATYNPLMEAYNDPPRTLDDLHARVSRRRLGYDVHHIVEKTHALADGFARNTVDGANNLVLIPTMKHWEINAWFQTPRSELGDLTPRQYIRGKPWSERRRMGILALEEAGVLVDE